MKTYQIQNKALTIVIEDKGAELLSLKRNDDDFEYLWQGDPAYWGRRAPILFPVVGKLKDDTYYIGDKAYTLNQHGFARDEMFTVVEQEAHKIVFELKENPKILKMYPYKFVLQLTYMLKDNCLLTQYRVENTNDQVMPFSIGAHPAFNMIDPSSFVFDTDEIHTDLIKAQGVDPCKKAISLKDKRLDIDVALFKDDALVLRDTDGVVFNHGSRRITLDCSGFPYLGLWSKPTGAPFVCLEPWYGLGDTINHKQNFFEKEGVMTLEVGQVFESTYSLTLD